MVFKSGLSVMLMLVGSRSGGQIRQSQSSMPITLEEAVEELQIMNEMMSINSFGFGLEYSLRSSCFYRSPPERRSTLARHLACSGEA